MTTGTRKMLDELNAKREYRKVFIMDMIKIAVGVGICLLVGTCTFLVGSP